MKFDNASIPANIYRRETYIERVKPFIGKNLIKALTGQRRVGKSYLLFQLINLIQEEQANASIIYINKEDLAFSGITNYVELNEYVQLHRSIQGKTYVFILDENLDIYCTGSNANLLSGELSTFLSGRYVEITIYSLSFPEYLAFHHKKADQTSLEHYFKFGGLPYLIHLPNEEAIIFEYLKNIYTTILYRDIVQRHSIRNVRFLEQLVLFLADNTGSLFSSKKISDFLKSQRISSSPTQVQNYVEYLANAFIIHKVSRYDIKGKQLFEIGEKYYFENLGIRHAIWGYRLEDRSKILENIVYNHLLFKGFKVLVGVLNPYEIDFVCEKNGEKLYIQVALNLIEEKTIEREFGNLLKIKDNYPKMVITLDSFKGNTYEGIVHKTVLGFLLE